VSSVNLQGVTEGYAVLDRVCGGMKEGSPLPCQEPGTKSLERSTTTKLRTGGRRVLALPNFHAASRTTSRATHSSALSTLRPVAQRGYLSTPRTGAPAFSNSVVVFHEKGRRRQRTREQFVSSSLASPRREFHFGTFRLFDGSLGDIHPTNSIATVMGDLPIEQCDSTSHPETGERANASDLAGGLSL